MKKKIFTMLAVLLLVSLFKMPVLAGDINADEQRIVTAISATYEFDGAYYKVTDAYILQVTTYLSTDGVDLSSSEVDDYLNQFYANIAVGISSGYMECIGKVPSGNETPKEEQKDSEENKEEQNENSDSDIEDEAENNPESTTAEQPASTDETSVLIEGAIKVTDLGVEEKSGDNTLGSIKDGVQEYTVAQMDPQDMYVWEIDELTVHAEAYKDSEIIGTLVSGDKVVVIGAATTGWAQIEYENGVGYVSSAYLRTPGYMIENGHIEIETTEAETDIEEETSTEESTKDYSDAEPYQSGISLGMIAIVIVIVVAVAMVGVILWHRNKSYKR